MSMKEKGVQARAAAYLQSPGSLGWRPRPLCPALAATLLVLMRSMVVLMLPLVPAA